MMQRLFKRSLGFLAFWLIITPTAQAQFLSDNLAPETLRYRMMSGPVEVGSSIVTISHLSEAGVIQIVESISGLFEQTTVISLRNDSTLEPRTSHTVISRDNKFQEVRLQYQERSTKVTGEVRRPPEFGGERRVDAVLEIGTADSYAVPHLLRCVPLAIGKAVQFPLFDGLQNAKGLTRGWIARIESVTVPAGSFECFRLEVHAGDARLILNLDTQFPHRIISRILPALGVKLELVAME